MANQIPLKAIIDNSGNVTALGQYTPTDTVPTFNGGIGLSIPLNSSGKILVTDGNNAMQEVSRGNLLAGNSPISITGSYSNSVVGGGNVSICLNVAGINISETTGQLPSTRITYAVSQNFLEPDVILDEGSFNV